MVLMQRRKPSRSLWAGLENKCSGAVEAEMLAHIAFALSSGSAGYKKRCLQGESHRTAQVVEVW